jgi:hypothetical protein
VDAITVGVTNTPRCPHCGGKLDGLAEAEAAPVAANSPPDPPELEDGDIFVPPEPALVQQFELMRVGKANQAKQAGHRIPGMPPLAAAPPPPPIVRSDAGALNVLDDPAIGGKITICVLLYGAQHFPLHRRCLHSICRTVPPSRMDLRVATNQVGPETMQYLASLPITKVYPDNGSRLKYAAMREMFWDADDPISSKYVVWFDDDSYVRDPVGRDWLRILAETIVAQKPVDNVGLYGLKMLHPLQQRNGRDPRNWFRQADWWRGRPFQDRKGHDAPNGQFVHFCVGGFWAISLAAIRACNIPDVRLSHNGGDCCIGEQCHQNGYKLKLFNERKQLIDISAAPPRGKSLPGNSPKKIMPWYA